MAKCYVQIGNSVGMCNYTGIGLHLREISRKCYLQTNGWMYSKDELNDCMWPLQYEVNLKRLTLQTHLTIDGLKFSGMIFK